MLGEGLDTIGEYTLLARIGRGGMGDVWLARRHDEAGREHKVALKVLPRTQSSQSQLIRRLSREARIIGRLEHPNIVALRAYSPHPVDGVFYLAMEYIDGLDCNRMLSMLRLQGRPGLEFALVAYVAQECLAALGYAHAMMAKDGKSLEIVHRDVTPSNILCGVDGSVKITDFGIAKSRHLSVATTEEFLVGKIPYMSPEQVDEEAIDQRSDLWSLGVVLHELATGRRLFGGSTPVERMAQVLGADIPPLCSVCRQYPQWFEAFLGGLLVRDRNERTPDAATGLQYLMRHLPKDVPVQAAQRLGALISGLQREAEAIPQESVSVAQTFTPDSRRGQTSARGEAQENVEQMVDWNVKDDATPLEVPFAGTDGEDKATPEAMANAFAAQSASAVSAALENDSASAASPAMSDLPKQKKRVMTMRYSGQIEPRLQPCSAEAAVCADGKTRRIVLQDLWEARSDRVRLGLWRCLQHPNAEHSPVRVLRSVPQALRDDAAALKRHQAAVERVCAVGARGDGFLTRILARHATFFEDGAVLDDKSVIPVATETAMSSAPCLYREIKEPRSVPLTMFMEDQIQRRLPERFARIRAHDPGGSGVSTDMERWAVLQFRIDVAAALLKMLLAGLAEWHGAGGFHGGLTPDGVLVEPLAHRFLPPDAEVCCWKAGVSPGPHLVGIPRITDIGLRELWEAQFAERLAAFNLGFYAGRLQGELGGLAPEDIDGALQTAAHPIRLYSPPEVVRGARPVGAETDLFFCGLLLFELLTGRYPFRERSDYTTLSKMLDPEYRPVSVQRLNPAVPEGLAAVVHRAIDKDPERRFARAGAFLCALEEVNLQAAEVSRGR